MTETCQRMTAEDAVKLMKPYAEKLAKRHSRHNRSLYEDLVQEGLMGAMQAADRFKPELGLKFTTFASPRVHGAIVDYIRDRDDHLSRVHRRQLGDDAPKVVSMDVRYLLHDCYGGTPGACSQKIGDRTYYRFDPPHHDGDHSDDRDAEFCAAVRAMCDGLSGVERFILRAYYVRQWRMKRISQHIGLSESRISQIHSGIVRRLAAASEERIDHARELMRWEDDR